MRAPLGPATWGRYSAAFSITPSSAVRGTRPHPFGFGPPLGTGPACLYVEIRGGPPPPPPRTNAC
jgi:hypothetical protein